MRITRIHKKLRNSFEFLEGFGYKYVGVANTDMPDTYYDCSMNTVCFYNNENKNSIYLSYDSIVKVITLDIFASCMKNNLTTVFDYNNTMFMYCSMKNKFSNMVDEIKKELNKFFKKVVDNSFNSIDKYKNDIKSIRQFKKVVRYLSKIVYKEHRQNSIIYDMCDGCIEFVSKNEYIVDNKEILSKIVKCIGIKGYHNGTKFLENLYDKYNDIENYELMYSITNSLYYIDDESTVIFCINKLSVEDCCYYNLPLLKLLCKYKKDIALLKKLSKKISIIPPSFSDNYKEERYTISKYALKQLKLIEVKDN